METGRSKTATLILAGGRGKRMGMLSHSRPKPLLPFGGEVRVIDFSLNNCVNSGLSHIGVLVDYGRSALDEYLEDWQGASKLAAYIHALHPKNGSYSGTADAVFQNLDYIADLGTETVLVLSGDHVYNSDYRELLAFHRQMEADVTVSVTKVPWSEVHRFGTVAVEYDGRIRAFKEKSSSSTSNLASMGIYVFKRQVLERWLLEDAMETDSPHDFGYAVLPRMVDSERVFAFEHGGYWRDIGTLESYFTTNMELLGPRAPFRLHEPWRLITGDRERTPLVSQKAAINNSIIGPGCVIEGKVENSILSGVRVAENAVIRDSIVISGCEIGPFSVVDHCILDESTRIGSYCYIGYGRKRGNAGEDLTIIGRDVRIPDRTAIGRQCQVNPGAELSNLSRQLIHSGTIV